MKPARILLLARSHADDLCASLRQILQASLGPSATVYLEVVDAADAESDAALVARIASRLAPSALVVTLDAESSATATCLLRALRACGDDTPVLVAVDRASPDELLGLIELGAADFVMAPLKEADVVSRVRRLLDVRPPGDAVVDSLKERVGLGKIVGESPSFVAEKQKLPLVAACDAGVMIVGETGTGKEVFARAIHYLSKRSNGPFVPVNCGAIPSELVENELFGHARGAYTGAAAAHDGLIREADGGTLFLDEVDCLPLAAQVKLLRFLQEKEYRPLGSAKTFKANLRVVAAANSDLEAAVGEGRLRRDLYFRLNVLPLSIPPLRERREDVLPLARHFLAKYRDEFDRRVTGFSVDAAQLLVGYDWPGNVRELEHTVERAVAMCRSSQIGPADVALPGKKGDSPIGSFKAMKERVVDQFEKTYVESLLRACCGNISEAARLAQKNRRAFWQLLRKHHIDAHVFKASASR